MDTLKNKVEANFQVFGLATWTYVDIIHQVPELFLFGGRMGLRLERSSVWIC